MAKQRTARLETEIVKKVKLNYLIYLPNDYNADSDVKWPLILFLHGAGERGSNIELVKRHGIPKIVEEQSEFPFIAVSPQCPANTDWTYEFDSLLALLDEITEHYTIDPARVYLTGLSMGGFGTWMLAMEVPHRFAAIAPICGGGKKGKIEQLKNVPVWAFHGAKDAVVSISQSETLVDALRECGGDVEFTVYPEADHDSWTETYDNPQLYTWFLSHAKREEVAGADDH